MCDVVGSGPVAVLLHGQPGTAADWYAVVGLLSDDFTVVVPDRLGWGRTGGPAGGFADNAAAVSRLLVRLDAGPAVIAGHSWAGGVGLAMAAASEPSIRHAAAGLVLVASVRPGSAPGRLDRFLAHRPLGDVTARMAFGATGRLVGMAPVQRRLDRRLRGPERVALEKLTRGQHDEPLWRSFAVEQRAFLDELPNLSGRVHSIAVPATVLAGTADHIVSPADGHRLADELPNGTWVSVVGAGHRLPHDHPVEVAAAVRDVAERAGLLR